MRNSIYILEETEEIYRILHTATRTISRIKVDGLTKDVIESLTKPKSEEEVFKNLIEKGHVQGDIETCIKGLIKLRVVGNSLPVKSHYIRQLEFLEELCETTEEAISLQKKVENTSVAIIGIGGIGTWMVNGLLQIGVGKLYIIDEDFVELSNLNRQLYFTRLDIGKRKVHVLRKRCQEPSKIVGHLRKLSLEDRLTDIFTQVDFVVNCADSPSVGETSHLIDETLRPLGKAYQVSGGYNLHLGMVGPIIVPGKTACFDCFLEHQKVNDPHKGMRVIKDIAQTGNVGPIAGAVANIQVMNIFKHLTQKGDQNYNKFQEIDFMNLSIYERTYAARKGCNCGN